MARVTDISGAEMWTIQAALAFYQQCGLGNAENLSPPIRAVATNGEQASPLNDEHISLLCERLNGADAVMVHYEGV